MFASVLTWLLLAAVAIQCLYAFGIFIRIFSLPKPKPGDLTPTQPVSIIICARDESANLKLHLPQIMAQRYRNELGKPLFEVIVVNDCSTDDTEAVLRELEQQYDNLWHVTISPKEKRTFPGKKFALSEGLKYAGHEVLVLIDADCAPSTEDWLGYMVQPFKEGKEIVAGYGKYKAEGNLLNAFTRWETLHTFLQYSSYASIGLPYMAVGRNLACTRALLAKAQKTEVWGKLPSGDDDLLIQAMATPANMAIVCDKRAFTITEGKRTWGDWARQKQRHLSTGKYYKEEVKGLLAGYAFSHTFMWLLFVIMLFTGWQAAALMVGIRSVIYWWIWAVAASRLRERALIVLFPLFDIGWMIYNFAFAPYIVLKNKTQWK